MSDGGRATARLTTERRGSILLVGIDRQEKRNALDHQMSEELGHVLEDARTGEPCILVLHSTTPGIFVSGADINELLERDADDALVAINAGLFERLEAHRWPTIAVVDGPALGGGCELAMACDLRVASPRARFGQPEPGLGILAGAGGNWRLPQLVGMAQARRMLYAGEQLDAAQASDAGLVDEIHEPDALLEGALALADRISRQSWRALELTKLALRLHRPATTAFDITAQALLFEGDDKRTRMEAFLARRRKPPG
jgi:enoyl-CoA hydratase